jgi:hypothetical protein
MPQLQPPIFIADALGYRLTRMASPNVAPPATTDPSTWGLRDADAN